MPISLGFQSITTVLSSSWNQMDRRHITLPTLQQMAPLYLPIAQSYLELQELPEQLPFHTLLADESGSASTVLSPSSSIPAQQDQDLSNLQSVSPQIPITTSHGIFANSPTTIPNSTPTSVTYTLSVAHIPNPHIHNRLNPTCQRPPIQRPRDNLQQPHRPKCPRLRRLGPFNNNLQRDQSSRSVPIKQDSLQPESLPRLLDTLHRRRMVAIHLHTPNSRHPNLLGLIHSIHLQRPQQSHLRQPRTLHQTLRMRRLRRQLRSVRPSSQ
jgi:hypothetical protein